MTGLLYAVEDLKRHVRASPDGLVHEDLQKIEIPAFDLRLLWTWDHSTNWDLGYEGQIDWGCVNAYVKAPEAYVADYTRLIDWASRNRFNGVIIWGFLRDSHGGIAAAQTICKYADERGVRVLVGVGTSFYGGFYYEGNHPFSADHWLKRHPEFAAHDKAGRPMPRLCPSEPANQAWLRDGTHWLFETFDIGGVNLESGDFMVCYCDRCRRLRAEMAGNDPDFFKEMRISIRPVIEEILTLRNDAWITFGTYTGFNPRPLPPDMGEPNPAVVLNLANMGSANPTLVEGLPEEAITQWSLTAMLHQHPLPLASFLDDGQPPMALDAPDWPRQLRPPSQQNLGLLHQGSQWYSRGNGHTRYSLEISSIKEACLRSQDAGLMGVAITGEMAPTYTACELNYLALSHFSYHPTDSLADFAKTTLAPLLGGTEAAIEYVTLLAKRESRQATALDEAKLAERLRQFSAQVEKGRDWDIYRRWRWLSTYCAPQVCDGTASVIWPS
jgi:hypothetical protein